MYPWFVFLHVLGVFGFLMAHGVTVSAFFALRRERSISRVQMLLEMSRGSLVVLDISILLLLASGIIAGFIGRWWSHAWIWASLVLLIGIFGAMEMLGVRALNDVRIALGLPSTRGQKPLEEPLGAEEIGGLLSQVQPARLASIGLGGLTVIAWLMVFKPF